jgi:hypothetical protein
MARPVSGSIKPGTLTPTPATFPVSSRAAKSRTHSMMRADISSGRELFGSSSRRMTRPIKSLVTMVVDDGLMSTPTAVAPAARRRRSVGLRPPVEAPAPISSMSPSDFNSSTMVETVERCSSVMRAMSAREMGSRSRT